MLGCNPWNFTKLNKCTINILTFVLSPQARNEYEVIVSHVNSLQHDIFLTQLPGVLNSLYSIATNMVAVVNNALKSFSEMQTVLVSGSAAEKVLYLEHTHAILMRRKQS